MEKNTILLLGLGFAAWWFFIRNRGGQGNAYYIPENVGEIPGGLYDILTED